MSWFTKLFGHGKNKDPAKGIEEAPEYGADTGAYSALDINPDGTLNVSSLFQEVETYSLQLARESIHKIASEVAKARPRLSVKNARLDYYICRYPNQYQTSSQFLYQLATLLLVDNNVYIVPIYDEYARLSGLWLASVSDAEIVQINGELWLQYDMHDGTKQVCQYSRCGHLKRMQYRKPFSGESNRPYGKIGSLYEDAINSARDSLRSNMAQTQWIAQLNQQLATAEQVNEQKHYLKDSNKSGGNTYVIDNRWSRFEQLKKQFNLLKAEDLDFIEKESYNYWGVSEAVLQNRYNETEWYAFYQSAIEPILIQIGEVLTKIVYSPRQVQNGNEIKLNTLQYSSIKSRIDVAFGIYDRGMATLNDSLNILNLPPLPEDEGNKRYIRGEYYQEGVRREEHNANRDETEPSSSDESGQSEQSE